MAAVPSPPPPPVPPLCSFRPNPPDRVPIPGHTALPFIPSPPVQETSPSPEAVHENGAVTASALEQSGPELDAPFPSPSSDDAACHCGGAPVQETDPAAKAMEQQEAANKQMDPPADGKQP